MVHGVSEPAPESFLVGTQGSVPEVGREISDRIPSLALNTCSILLSQEILRELLGFLPTHFTSLPLLSGESLREPSILSPGASHPEKEILAG